MDMPGIEDCAARASGVRAKMMAAARVGFMGTRVTRRGQKANAEVRGGRKGTRRDFGEKGAGGVGAARSIGVLRLRLLR